MKERVLVICDNDREYIDRLGGYISRREGAAVNVACFSDREKLKAYIQDNPVDALLAGKDWIDEGLCADKNRWILLSEFRSEDGLGEEASGYQAVYRYQPAEDIFSRVLQSMELPGGGRAAIKAATVLYGVYSPGGWTETTRLALSMVRYLGRDGPAVYMGLNEFSPVRGIAGKVKSRDLSDLIYCWRRGRLTYEQMERMTSHLDGFDCIPAPVNPAELAELMGDEAISFVEAVCGSGGYRYAVLDFGAGISGWLNLFRVCRRNFVLFSDTETGSIQQEEYRRFWESIGAGEVSERTSCVVLPFGELRTGKRDRTEEYMNELAERLLRRGGEDSGGGGDTLC